MPERHKYISEWNPERIKDWGFSIGEYVKIVIENILCSKKYPEQMYKVCIGIINLSKKYGKERVNNACKRAIKFDIYSNKKIKNILEQVNYFRY